MLMKIIILLSIVTNICIGLSFADQKINVPFRIKSHVGELTCKEFLALEDVHKPMLVAWFDGYHAKTKSLKPINVAVIEKIVPIAVESCKVNPNSKVQDDIMKAIDHVGYTDDK